MPLFDQMLFDQKWSLWDTWSFRIGRGLKVVAVATQLRFVNVLATQHRIVNAVATQYRKLRVHIR